MTLRLHRKRGMGRFSFWAEAVLGPYRWDLYFEPVNGWRHGRLAFWKRPHALWLGAFLLIPQRWRRKR